MASSRFVATSVGMIALSMMSSRSLHPSFRFVEIYRCLFSRKQRRFDYLLHLIAFPNCKDFGLQLQGLALRFD